ncbi:carboxypeptidase-like regulatory domain-containing protein [Flavobacterium sp.]|jgi:hypothetical protein|uniref:carboxypeptidase-like regulatory domain-containing protein n=1 Tax=Flavobacterium sp. TaxID=239 RepID=UPI0037BFBBD6
MKVKLVILSLFFIIQFGFSQTEKPIKGKVTSDDFAIQGVEILNLRSKKTTITNTDGDFSIMAKAKDTLMFIAKNYQYKKVILEMEHNEKNKLLISLVRKPEELEEVVVISKIAFPKIKFDKNITSQLTIEKAAINRKPTGVYDGTIENGMGITIPLGSGRKKIHQIEFKELIKKTNDENYYLEILKLKPEELGLFIEFCDADPKSKKVLENSNPLKILDFLFLKNIEFKKLNASEKK